jgi:hypothetical protein
MVQYKVFNIYDPLNVNAAHWLHERLRDSPPGTFPVDPRPVRDLDFAIKRLKTPGEA